MNSNATTPIAQQAEVLEMRGRGRDPRTAVPSMLPINSCVISEFARVCSVVCRQYQARKTLLHRSDADSKQPIG
jgi:hypothetical protein